MVKFFTARFLKVKSNPDISHAEKLENLLLLDNDHAENQTTIANLPSNIEVMKP